MPASSLNRMTFPKNGVRKSSEFVTGFGLPANVQVPECFFVVPFTRRFVTVVSVAGRRFRFLILGRALYNVIPDPFAITARFPPQWDKTGTLPTLEWPDEPLPKRTIKQLDHIFKHGDGPFLLGACQTLVDSAKITLIRDQPATDLCRDLWALLPDSIRRQTSLSTFAYSRVLGFGLAAMPAAPEDAEIGFLTEDQARDYPESRYERELQVAVEYGDQRTVDRLFAKEHRRDPATSRPYGHWGGDLLDRVANCDGVVTEAANGRRQGRRARACCSRRRFRAAGEFHGFRAFAEDFRRKLLAPEHLSYRPRGDVETDPTFKQLIPYVVLRSAGELFHYPRGRSGSETRLQALRSVGLGGHISHDDGPVAADPYRADVANSPRKSRFRASGRDAPGFHLRWPVAGGRGAHRHRASAGVGRAAGLAA